MEGSLHIGPVLGRPGTSYGGGEVQELQDGDSRALGAKPRMQVFVSTAHEAGPAR